MEPIAGGNTAKSIPGDGSKLLGPFQGLPAQPHDLSDWSAIASVIKPLIILPDTDLSGITPRNDKEVNHRQD